MKNSLHSKMLRVLPLEYSGIGSCAEVLGSLEKYRFSVCDSQNKVSGNHFEITTLMNRIKIKNKTCSVPETSCIPSSPSPASHFLNQLS